AVANPVEKAENVLRLHNPSEGPETIYVDDPRPGESLDLARRREAHGQGDVRGLVRVPHIDARDKRPTLAFEVRARHAKETLVVLQLFAGRARDGVHRAKHCLGHDLSTGP